MPNSMILLPRTSSDEEQHEAILDLLEDSAETAQLRAAELRCGLGVNALDGARLARALRRTSRLVFEAIDDPELSSDEAGALLAKLQCMLDEAERLIMGADIRLAVDDATFARIGDSVTAIGNFAAVGFAGYVGELKIDLKEFMAIEREAPVPLMHALQRVVGEGFAHARETTQRPPWLASRLGRTLGDFLEGADLAEPPLSLISPFVRVASVACEQVGAAWRAEQPTRTLERLAHARTTTVDATLDTLALQRERLETLPDLARWFDVGFGYGLIEPLLDELAARQDLLAPRNANAALWFDLLMASDDT